MARGDYAVPARWGSRGVGNEGLWAGVPLLAFKRPPNRRYQVASGPRFHHIVEPARFHSRLNDLRVGGGADKDDLRLWGGLAHLLGRFYAAHVRQPDVHENDIGLQRPCFEHALHAVVCHLDRGQARFVEMLGREGPPDCVVVDEKEPNISKITHTVTLTSNLRPVVAQEQPAPWSRAAQSRLSSPRGGATGFIPFASYGYRRQHNRAAESETDSVSDAAVPGRLYRPREYLGRGVEMNADLGLTTGMYGIAAGLFYVTYVLFEVPSNLILAHVGARRWIARIMVSWGIVAAGMCLVQSAMQLYVMRLLLGAAEAGFTPGIIYYLSCWYPRSDRARAMSFFYIGATLASMIGVPLSGTLLGMNGVLGIAGWRWLFLLEGLPAIALGFVVLSYLPDTPAKAPWLSDAQKEWLTRVMRKETDSSPVAHSTLVAPGAAQPPRVAAALFWFLQAFATLGITIFLPLIVRSVSTESDLVVTLFSGLPFMFACVFMYLNGRHSDRSGERRLHLGAPLLAAGAPDRRRL